MTIEIAVMNESTEITDEAVQFMLPALETQWNRDLIPIWPVDDVKLTFVAQGAQPAPTEWWLVFLNDADQAGALAYHDLTPTGLPISKVFVKTIMDDGDRVSVATSHELLEMAVDPWLNAAFQDHTGRFWAGEIADPVEDAQYGYDIGGVEVSDFVTPNWFGHQHPTTQMDFGNHAGAAFSILPGGYAQWFNPSPWHGGGGWQQVIGHMAASGARAVTPPVGSRRERRLRKFAGGAWRCSCPPHR